MTDKGFTEKVTGKVKETTGNILEDGKLKAEGLAEQVVGKTKEVAEDVKDVAEKLVEKAKHTFKK